MRGSIVAYLIVAQSIASSDRYQITHKFIRETMLPVIRISISDSHPCNVRECVSPQQTSNTCIFRTSLARWNAVLTSSDDSL